MRRLINVLQSGRVDLSKLVTHHYKLEQIVDAYDLFAHQRDGVLKVAIKNETAITPPLSLPILTAEAEQYLDRHSLLKVPEQVN